MSSYFVRRAVQVLICTLLPAAVWAGPVDINTADAATIAKELQGIGLSKAQDIVEYREKNGAFKSADELRKIKMIWLVGNLTIMSGIGVRATPVRIPVWCRATRRRRKAALQPLRSRLAKD